jgi:gamma-glutamyltranspeptidase/glutathione hydrolase
VVDRTGTLVSFTTTIESGWGSGVTVPGRGFLLNNELTDFSAAATDPASGLPYANRPEGGKRPRRTALGPDATTAGGKRPRSSMTPTIVAEADGTPLLATGAPGGSTIIASTTSMLVNVLDLFRGTEPHGLPATDEEMAAATVMGRVMAQNTGSATVEPSGLLPGGAGGCRPGDNSRYLLEARGYNISTGSIGLVQTVLVVPDSGTPPLLVGACDSTRQYQGESACLAAGV